MVTINGAESAPPHPRGKEDILKASHSLILSLSLSPSLSLCLSLCLSLTHLVHACIVLVRLKVHDPLCELLIMHSSRYELGIHVGHDLGDTMAS